MIKSTLIIGIVEIMSSLILMYFNFHIRCFHCSLYTRILKKLRLDNNVSVTSTSITILSGFLLGLGLIDIYNALK